MVHETGTLVAPVRWGVGNFLCWLANGGSPKHCFSTLLRLKRKGFKGGEWRTCQTACCYGVDIACRLCFAHPCTNTVKSCYCVLSNYDQNVRSCESSHRANVFLSWIIRSCKVCFFLFLCRYVHGLRKQIVRKVHSQIYIFSWRSNSFL